MLQKATLDFLRQLKLHNDKGWFDEHRKEYETAKADFEQFVTELLKAMIPIEPGLATQGAKDCIFRIFRDVRFSKDKTPYKAHFSAYFSSGGKKWNGAGYYIHIEPGAAFAGGGLWAPEPPILKAVRQEIDYGLAEFEGIIHNKAFKKLFAKLNGEVLQRPPQGYEADNPAIEYLKMKGWTVGTPIKDEMLTRKDVVQKVVDVFTIMKPFVDFLNRAVNA